MSTAFEVPSWLWIVFTLAAAASQTFRNAMQKGLTGALGTVGATHVRFLFGLPFALCSLLIVSLAIAAPWPVLNAAFWGWAVLGGVAQMLATGLMLAAMQARSFVVTTAYTKTEPIQVALFGLIFLGERLSLWATASIVLATAGVLLMSLPSAAARGTARPGGNETGSAAGAAQPGLLAALRPALLGIAAGAVFAIAAVAFRAAILALGQGPFVLHATVTLACGLSIQTALLSTYLMLRERAVLVAILHAWRPSLLAGFFGALASQMWFLAFAIESAARVRTLGLAEILFAQVVSRRMFAQNASRRERIGILMIVAGVAALLSG